ncbi:hypothetical protein NXA99_10535 [Citrobacter amalonaticus]|nr:hypothetical protein [Citrobacter amalonaticus]MCR9028978.1 hypothetical protein [Citrobacter amalonaticus]
MKSPVRQKQKPSYKLGSLNSGARTGLTPQALNSAPVALAPEG